MIKSMSRILKPKPKHEFFLWNKIMCFAFFLTYMCCFDVYCNAVLSELDLLILWVRTESIDI